ncbi:MAG: hypothetical protein U0X93_11215 [Anaerolineales bacterium]
MPIARLAAAHAALKYRPQKKVVTAKKTAKKKSAAKKSRKK